MNRRPRLEILSSTASPEEAAAVVAALERFMRDHAPATLPTGTPRSTWVRAALLEGVGARFDPVALLAWGDSDPWG